MKLKRILATLMAILTAVVLSACNSDNGQGQEQGGQDTLTKVLQSKKLVVGVFADAPPWGVMNSNGEYEGYDIDIAEALAASLGAEIEYVSTTNANRIPLLEAGRVDVVIAGLTATYERAQAVALTRPYAAAGQVLVIPTGSDIESYDDLAGKRVAATRGSIPATLLERDFPDANATLFEAVADAIQALKSGQVDALMESNAVSAGVVSGDDNFMILEAPQLNPALVSFGVKMGDQGWLNYLNTFIMIHNISDEANVSNNQWLGADTPDLIK